MPPKPKPPTEADLVRKILGMTALPENLRLSDALNVLGTPTLQTVTPFHFDADFLLTRRTFEEELAKLRKRVEDQARSLSEEKTTRREKEERIRTLETRVEEQRARKRTA